MKTMTLILPLALAFAVAACGGKEADNTAQQTEAAPATEAKVNPSAPPQSTEPARQLAEADAKPVEASGAHPGKTLHDANCISCHDSGVYTRADHKMQDFAMLSAQVRRCDANIGSQLLDEDMDKLTDYLNIAFYQFPKE